MADQFEVATATLRAVAGQFGDRADEAGKIADKAGEADVDTKSWGLLGLSLGMYAGYTSARSTADESIGKVRTFLTDAQSALSATADDYDAADHNGGQLFDTIQKGLS